MIDPEDAPLIRQERALLHQQAGGVVRLLHPRKLVAELDDAAHAIRIGDAEAAMPGADAQRSLIRKMPEVIPVRDVAVEQFVDEDAPAGAVQAVLAPVKPPVVHLAHRPVVRVADAPVLQHERAAPLAGILQPKLLKIPDQLD